MIEAAPAGVEQAAYSSYLRVREEVLRLKKAGAGADASRYWAEELDNIDYLMEASPLIIRKLRHHTFHITGIRPYDYKEYADRQPWFERRLTALISLAGGSDLLVPEAEALGGFGYRIDGRLYNVDTLKFFEVLVGMRRAGLLDAFAPGTERRLVWEIGAGWGGFAYQFKTLFPDTTYAIVDFPELFLFSATYLSTLFPKAVIRFAADGEHLENWHEADFIFIPSDRADVIRHARPDLLVNIVSFQEMTIAQVEAYVDLAASAGCRAIYSLNRDRSPFNTEIDSVSAMLSRHYDVREIPLLGSGYVKAFKKDSALSVDEARRSGYLDPAGYRHMTGSLKPVEANASRRRTSGTSPRVGIGVTLHNRAEYLKEALDSLLAQTYANLKLVLVDDGSTDGTESIAKAYEQRDTRVRYIRFDQRQGMIAAWRAAFEHATADGATYFAWGSDHDRWHPDWLRTLVDTLETYPDVMLAYPLTQRIDPTGQPLAKPGRQFETFGIMDRDTRWTRLSRSDSVASGDIVYGLMRTEAVRDSGVFRQVLCPDRLLIAELTLRGQIRQVPDVLWFRRQFTTGSIERQRATLFGPATQPPSTLTPPWYLHARLLWRTYGRPASAPLGIPKSTVARLVTGYAAAYAWRHYAKSSVQHGIRTLLGWPRWIYKRAKHLVLLAVYQLLVTVRHRGATR